MLSMHLGSAGVHVLEVADGPIRIGVIDPRWRSGLCQVVIANLQQHHATRLGLRHQPSLRRVTQLP